MNCDKLPKIFWLDKKGKMITGDTHTNLVVKTGKIADIIFAGEEPPKKRSDVMHKLVSMDITAREYAMQHWDWIRCRREPNARSKFVIEMWEYTPSVRRRLENIFEPGEIVETEQAKDRRMKEIVL